MAAPHSSLVPMRNTPLTDQKSALRASAKQARAVGDPAWGLRLSDHVLALVPIGAGAVIGGFWPLPGEIDVRPLLTALYRRGHGLALPVTPPRGNPLVFHGWQPGDALVPGRFGTMHPVGFAVVPDVVLVPLLAFDRTLHRLGYGGGYYDRTLAAMPGCRTIGCAFEAQRVERVPVGPHDIPLDAVATECGVYFPEACR